MLNIGKTSPQYLPSPILSKKIRLFNDHAVKLLPFLKQTTKFVELDTSSQTAEKSFQDICKVVEPTILHIRSYAEGSNSEQDVLKEQMIETLTANWGYSEVNVNELISLENERRTELGKQLLSTVATGKMISSDLIVQLLRKVIYSGDGRNKFILSGGFPFTVDHAKDFEKQVSSLAAVIYSAMVYEDSSVHVKGNLSDFTITTLFQKDFRLRVLTDWDESNWQELFDEVKIDWCLILGQPYSGKTTLGSTLRKALGGPSRVTVVNPSEIEASIKSTLGTAEEPFEGKVPLNKIEDAIANKIKADKKAGKRLTYVFDSFPGQTSATEFARFARDKLGCPPDFIIQSQVSEPAVLQARHKKKLEVEADLSEEQIEQFR